MTVTYRIKPEEVEQMIDRYFQEMTRGEYVWEIEDGFQEDGSLLVEIYSTISGTLEHPGLPASMTADALWEDEDLIVDDKGDDYLGHLSMTYSSFAND